MCAQCVSDSKSGGRRLQIPLEDQNQQSPGDQLSFNSVCEPKEAQYCKW